MQAITLCVYAANEDRFFRVLLNFLSQMPYVYIHRARGVRAAGNKVA